MPGLYRMLQPLVAAAFVAMFERPLSFFQAAIEISTTRTTRKAFMKWVASMASSPLYVGHTEGEAPNLRQAVCKLGLERDCLKENALYRLAATAVSIEHIGYIG